MCDCTRTHCHYHQSACSHSARNAKGKGCVRAPLPPMDPTGSSLAEGREWKNGSDVFREREGDGIQGKRDWEGGERKTKEGHGWMVGYMNGW